MESIDIISKLASESFTYSGKMMQISVMIKEASVILGNGLLSNLGKGGIILPKSLFEEGTFRVGFIAFRGDSVTIFGKSHSQATVGSDIFGATVYDRKSPVEGLENPVKIYFHKTTVSLLILDQIAAVM